MFPTIRHLLVLATLTTVQSLALATPDAVAAPDAVSLTASPAATQALERLKEGNLRYLQGIEKYPKIDPARRLRTATEGQKPIATVLGCSDARVPVEATFDKAFGELFVVRVAGNVCHMAELASIEYGVNYLKTPLVVVLGHTNCGAVGAAVSGQELSGSLPKLIAEITPAVEETKKLHPELSGSELVEASIKQNVWKSIEDLLRGSSVIARAVAEKRVVVVGAVRELTSGRVTWLGPHPQQEMLTKAIKP